MLNSDLRASSPGVIRLRPAEASDGEAVSELLQDSGLVPLDETAQFGLQYVVAIDGEGIVVGAAGIERYGANGLLRSVVVAPEWRNRGVGSSLVKNRLAWAQQAGITTLYLLTTTAADYWARAGFVAVDRGDAPPEVAASHEWKSACPASATSMKLRLQQASSLSPSL